MEDRRVEARVEGLLQKHAVEHLAHPRLEAEAHVAQAQQGARAGDLALDQADAFEGVQGAGVIFGVAAAQGEGERVDEHVAGRESVLRRQRHQPLRHFQLLLGRAGHALLVDGQRHDRGAEAAA